jgi:molybdopterin synthase catalytic subunit
VPNAPLSGSSSSNGIGRDSSDVAVGPGRGSVRRALCRTLGGMGDVRTDDVWCVLSEHPLDTAAVSSWVVRPETGASVLFTGTARDHAPGRTGVTRLEYEAYEEQVLRRLDSLATILRGRWPVVGRVALHHRVGGVSVGEAAVIVAVSAPHRAEAFEAARWAIDTLKSTVPIWKKEYHAEGESWGTEAQHLEEGEDHDLASPPSAASTTTTTKGV